LRIRIGNGLLPLNLLVIALVAAIIFLPSSILQISLGLPFVIFFPGYALLGALFPKREGLSSIERVALSCGVSIALAPIIGFLLYYASPWNIDLYSILFSTTLFILVASVIASFRRKQVLPEERFDISFNLNLPQQAGASGLDKTLSIFLMLAILVAIGTLGYVIAKPKVGESFSEFYVLGLEGQTTDYEKELAVGDKGEVLVGIVNQEREVVSYRVEVVINGVLNNEVEGVTLEHNEKWENAVSFTPDVVTNAAKVDFLLYKQGQTEVYRMLRLWVDIIE